MTPRVVTTRSGLPSPLTSATATPLGGLAVAIRGAAGGEHMTGTTAPSIGASADASTGASAGASTAASTDASSAPSGGSSIDPSGLLPWEPRQPTIASNNTTRHDDDPMPGMLPA